MRSFLGFVGVVKVIQGVGGLLGHLGLLWVPQRFGVVNRLSFMEGYEVLGNLAVAALGVILLVVVSVGAEQTHDQDAGSSVSDSDA